MWTDYFVKKKKKSLADALSKVALFKDIHKKDLKELAKIAHIRHYHDDETIFKQKDPSYGIFIILKGEIEIFIQNKRRKLNLATYHELEHFGEFSLSKKNTRKASATAKGDVVLCYLFREDVLKLFEEHPRLGLAVYHTIMDELIEKLEFADDYLMKENEKNPKQQ